MATTRAGGFARARCVECGHEFTVPDHWAETRPCPACGHLASRPRHWLMRALEWLALAALTFLFWAYWWF